MEVGFLREQVVNPVSEPKNRRDTRYEACSESSHFVESDELAVPVTERLHMPRRGYILAVVLPAMG